MVYGLAAGEMATERGRAAPVELLLTITTQAGAEYGKLVICYGVELR